MNISSGLSSITIPGSNINNKISIWPSYNAGKVTRVPAVHEKIDPEFTYVKKAQNNSASGSPAYTEYTSKGASRTFSGYTSGSYFEALV